MALEHLLSVKKKEVNEESSLKPASDYQQSLTIPPSANILWTIIVKATRPYLDISSYLFQARFYRQVRYLT